MMKEQWKDCMKQQHQGLLMQTKKEKCLWRERIKIYTFRVKGCKI